MKDMKPVAWLENTGCNRYETNPDVVESGEKSGISYTPLYALPEGHVIVSKHDIMSWYDAFQEQCVKPQNGGDSYARQAIDAMIKTAQEEG